jgi:hypothetical protein
VTSTLLAVIEMGEVVTKKEPTLDSELLAKSVVRLMKRDIFEQFIKSGELSAEDQEFCDSIDWYPVDELPLREEYVKKLKQIEKGPHSRMTLEELDELMGLK